MGTLKKDVLGEVEHRLIAAFAGRDDVQSVVTATIELVREDYGNRTQYVQRDSNRKRRQRIIQAWLKQREQGVEDRAKLAREFNVHLTTIGRVITRYLNDQSARYMVDNEWR